MLYVHKSVEMHLASLSTRLMIDAHGYANVSIEWLLTNNTSDWGKNSNLFRFSGDSIFAFPLVFDMLSPGSQ